MKTLLVFLLTAATVLGQGIIPFTTPYTRDLLYATNAAHARAKLGVGGGTGDALYTDFNTNYFRTNVASGGKIGIATGETTPHWVNVKDPPYSAVGDGSTDDTTAIQTALNAVQSTTRPARLYLPAGLYRTTASVNITNSNVQIVGDGQVNSVIRVTASGIGQAFLVNNSAARLFNVQFNGIRIEGTNGLASPPDGIVMRNVSQWKIEEVWGTGLNNGFVLDGSEVAAIRDSTVSLNVAGIYLTSQDGNLAVSEVLVDNLIADHNTNATVLVDGAAAKLTFKNSRFENTTRGFLFRNRAGTDADQDVVTIEDVFVQNNVGEGFEKGTFLLAQPSNVTNYHILQSLSVLNSRANLPGASNAIEFIKGSNTNVSTAAHDVSVQRSMFASITNSAIYSDNSLVNGEVYQLWTQGGLPETSGSGTWTRELYPAGLLWRDTNNVQGTLLTRTAGNNVQLWSFSTNSGIDISVFDNTKALAVDIGNDGNNLSLSSSLLTITGQGLFTGNLTAQSGFDVTGQINAGSENRNITLANGRVDFSQFDTNGATVNQILKFNGTTWILAADEEGAGATGDNVLGNGTSVSDASGVSITNSATAVIALDTSTTPDLLTINPTNLTAAQLATDSVSADELNATGVEAELEAVMDLQDLQGAVTDAQVPDTITIGGGLLDASGFNGNLTTTDNTVQEVAQKLDDLTAGVGDMVKAQSNLVTGTVLYQMVAAQVTGTNVFIDSSTNIVFHNITTNFALVFTNWSNNTGEKTIIITEDATGGHPPAFESGVLWENSTNTDHASIPNFPTNAGVSYVLTAYRRNGTNWIRGPGSIDSKLLVDIANLSANGLITKTGAGGIAARTITGDTEIVVANGDGVSGNPTLSVGSTIARDSEVAAVISDTAFASSWNGVTTIAPSKNAVYDFLHLGDTDDDGFPNVIDADGVEWNGTTDTTLTRSSAGNVAIEGNVIYRAGGTDVAVADGGTGLSSGTSGGILGYTASGTLASSAALAANSIVIGGGAGATPTTTTTGTGVLTAIGLAVDGSGPLVLATGANLTNIVVTGQTNTDLTASLPVFTDSTKKLTSTGTIDASSANVTLKRIRSLKFVASSFRLVDNAGCTIPNTNDFTLNTFMVPQFSGTGASNANFMRFMCRVPKHIDTSVAMTASLSVELTAADTAAHSYHVGVVSVANSAQIDTAATTFIDMAISGDGSGAAEDIESVNDVTLTGWAATLTANQWMVVELRRNGADASTVASRFQELEIFYTDSQ